MKSQVLLVVTIMLITLAAVNAVFITRSTVQDSRQHSAVTRALGASPQQVILVCPLRRCSLPLWGHLGIPGGLALVGLVSPARGPPYPAGIVAGSSLVVGAP